MSSLTDEQRKRIEENRAKALAKLAQKRFSLAHPQPARNASFSSPSSSKHSNDSIVTSSSYNQDRGAQNFSRFQYHHSKKPSNEVFSINKSQNKSANTTVNAKVTNGTCIIISKTRFKVVAKFHAKLVGVFKSLQSRCYDPQTRTWSFLLDDYEKLMALCKPLASEVILSGFPKEVAQLFLSKNKENPQDSTNQINWDLIDKKLVDSLMPFQREGVIIKQNGRVLLADDMGLGKTIQAIAVAAYYRTKWPLLVIVPSSLRMTWRRAFFRWLPSVDPQQVNVVLTGKDPPSAGLVNVISYDLVVKNIHEIKKVGYNIIIVDECHAIKNSKTERTKAILPLLKASLHVILISGTPALSRPSELHTQISAVKPNLFPSFHHYGLRYCAAVKNHFGWDYSGSSNMEELQLILEECIMIRRLKKVVLDQLPSKTREVVYLDPSLINVKTLTGAEQKLVKAPVKGQRAAILEYFTKTSSVKLSAVKAYVLDLLEGGHKIIIFAHHRAMLDVICETLLKKKIEYIRIDGSTMSAKRQHLCDQFQRSTETRVAVLSLTAANTGLTLTAATCVVFAELFWNPGALVQAEDRAYRIGQKNSVVIHYLIARKTADDYIWPLIQKKLEVLSEAGLNKENFNDLDKKTFQDPQQRNLKDLFESMIEDSDDDNSFVEECLNNSIKGVGISSDSSAPGEAKMEKSRLWVEKKNERGHLQINSGEKCSNVVDSKCVEESCSTRCSESETKREKTKLWSEWTDKEKMMLTNSVKKYFNVEKSESCSAGCSTNEMKKEKAKLWSEWKDGGETSQTSNADSSHSSLLHDTSEDWFDDIGNEDCDDLCALESMEPRAKRKRY